MSILLYVAAYLVIGAIVVRIVDRWEPLDYHLSLMCLGAWPVVVVMAGVHWLAVFLIGNRELPSYTPFCHPPMPPLPTDEQFRAAEARFKDAENEPCKKSLNATGENDA